MTKIGHKNTPPHHTVYMCPLKTYYLKLNIIKIKKVINYVRYVIQSNILILRNCKLFKLNNIQNVKCNAIIDPIELL